MSRHVPRRDRWRRLGPNEYVAAGAQVRYERGAWYAWVCYRQLPEATPGEAAAWEPRRDRVGPFKRPRNAMMAAEEQMTLLGRRLGGRVAFDPAEGLRRG
jgi:hypothetical protein